MVVEKLQPDFSFAPGRTHLCPGRLRQGALRRVCLFPSPATQAPRPFPLETRSLIPGTLPRVSDCEGRLSPQRKFFVSAFLASFWKPLPVI